MRVLDKATNKPTNVTEGHERRDRSTRAAGSRSAMEGPWTPLDVVRLQRAVGNRAVGRLIQTKLNVSEPDDPSEREADEIADLVVAMPATVARTSAAAGEQDGPDVESRINATRGAGSSLSDDTRGFFESRMQADFSRVRVHTDGEAAQLNRALNARAFAYGRDIYFGANEYRPDTLEGRRLLAHELTHVVQQGGATGLVQRVVPAAAAAMKAAEWIALGTVGYSLAQSAVSSTAGDVTYSFDEMEGVLLPEGGNDVQAYHKDHPDARIRSETHDIAVWAGTSESRKLGIRFGIDFNCDGHALGNISCRIIETYDWPIWSGSVNVNITPLSLSAGGISKVRITLNLNYDRVGFGGKARSRVLELDGTGAVVPVRGDALVSLDG